MHFGRVTFRADCPIFSRHQDNAFDRKQGGKLIRGNYYKRGKQIGEAIAKAWPGAQVVMAYGFPYAGLESWAAGHVDAGLSVKIGIEHTYGAGPCSGPYYKGAWYARTAPSVSSLSWHGCFCSCPTPRPCLPACLQVRVRVWRAASQ
jgi:hypothetical protein